MVVSPSVGGAGGLIAAAGGAGNGAGAAGFCLEDTEIFFFRAFGSALRLIRLTAMSAGKLNPGCVAASKLNVSCGCHRVPGQGSKAGSGRS